MPAKMTFGCDHCEKAAEDDYLLPLSVSIAVSQAGETAFMDSSRMPGWMRLIFGRGNRRVELTAECAKNLVIIHPDLVAGVIAEEVQAKRLPAELGEMMLEMAKADYEVAIQAAAAVLDLDEVAPD